MVFLKNLKFDRIIKLLPSRTANIVYAVDAVAFRNINFFWFLSSFGFH